MTPAKPAGLRVVAIAAMAENRVIGRGDELPWNLPDDMKWFSENTRGKTLLMGRKTFESIGKPLPKRRTVVLSRSADAIEGVDIIHDLSGLTSATGDLNELWVAGGMQVYELTKHWWDELLLTRVKRTVEGDAFFPRFEDRMQLVEVVRETDEMRIERYVRATMVA
jgi:dihydrofolate reductase